MLTVPEAARRADRRPETIRRWIREGRLRSRKVGTQHVIEERDLEAVIEEPRMLDLPERLRRFDDGSPVPDWVRAIHDARRGR